MSIPPTLKQLLRESRVKRIPKAQIILYEGDTPSEVFVIKSGVVKLYDIDDQGNEKILHIVKTPAVVPFAFFAGGERAIYWFYAALTDCELYVLSQERLVQAMLADGELALFLINSFTTDVHELLVRLGSLEKTNTRDKIIASLAFLSVHHADRRRNGWRRVSFPTNHQLLADISGITRESASVVMKELQDEKIIRNPRLAILEINHDRLVNSKKKHQNSGI